MKSLKSIFLLLLLCLINLSCDQPVNPSPNTDQNSNEIILVWKGELDSPPSNPQSGWVYYNTVDKKTYLYDGTTWQIIARDGKDGEDGEDGQDSFISIIWMGELSSPPLNPEAGWVYYNTTEKKTYMYDGTTWQIIARDGTNGEDGAEGTTSIIWMGELSSPPPNPEVGWVYYNTEEKKTYLYDGTTWQIIARDGSDGEDGQDGTNGVDGQDGEDGQDGADFKKLGNITVDTTWTMADSPYFIENTIVVKEGVILTVEAGVIITIQPGQFFYIDGTLVMNGTTDNHIILESEGTDTASLYFTESSFDNVMNYVEGTKLSITNHSTDINIDFCKFTRIQSVSMSGNVTIKNTVIDGSNTLNPITGLGIYGFCILENCIIRGYTFGIILSNGSLEATNCSIEDISSYTVNASGESNVIIISSNMYPPTQSYSFLNSGANNQSVTNCYWGTTDENIIKSRIMDKIDNASYGLVDYSGFVDTPFTVTGCGY